MLKYRFIWAKFTYTYSNKDIVDQPTGLTMWHYDGKYSTPTYTPGLQVNHCGPETKNISFNLLTPGRYGCYLNLTIFNLISRIFILCIFGGIALTWMPQDLTDDKSALVLWRHMAPSFHNGLSQIIHTLFRTVIVKIHLRDSTQPSQMVNLSLSQRSITFPEPGERKFNIYLINKYDDVYCDIHLFEKLRLKKPLLK